MQQIEFVSQHLKPEGIFLLVEKFRSENEDAYIARERQKDFGFKARYFEWEHIKRKASVVLSTMHDNEVTLGEMGKAVHARFRYCLVTWNSGNFYGLAASNSETSLRAYLSVMLDPAIPSEYIYEPQPYTDLAGWIEQRRVQAWAQRSRT